VAFGGVEVCLHALYSWQVAPIIHWMGECSGTGLEVLKEKYLPPTMNELQFLASVLEQ